MFCKHKNVVFSRGTIWEKQNDLSEVVTGGVLSFRLPTLSRLVVPLVLVFSPTHTSLSHNVFPFSQELQPSQKRSSTSPVFS